MGLTVVFTMSFIVAADAIKEVGAAGAGVAWSEFPTGGAGVSRTIHPKVTNLLTLKAFL
jgi:hypothetical protein